MLLADLSWNSFFVSAAIIIIGFALFAIGLRKLNKDGWNLTTPWVYIVGGVILILGVSIVEIVAGIGNWYYLFSTGMFLIVVAGLLMVRYGRKQLAEHPDQYAKAKRFIIIGWILVIPAIVLYVIARIKMI